MVPSQPGNTHGLAQPSTYIEADQLALLEKVVITPAQYFRMSKASVVVM
jgi:hypothetical protein